jgi:hypothetical protein
MNTAPETRIGTILIVALSGFLLGFDGSLFTGAVGFVEREFRRQARDRLGGLFAAGRGDAVNISPGRSPTASAGTILRLATCVSSWPHCWRPCPNFATLIVAL